MFLKTLLILLDVTVCEHDGVAYDKDSILEFHFTDIFLSALSELTKEVKSPSYSRSYGSETSYLHQ